MIVDDAIIAAAVSTDFREPYWKKKTGNAKVFWTLAFCIALKYGAPDKIRTCGLWLRRPTLYPTELRAHQRELK